jgi:diguanylate cyclase (GGDEF)-like protein/PAS domain S-box-containing protein
MLGGGGPAPFILKHADGVSAGVRELDQGSFDVVLLGISVPGALAINSVDRVHRHAAGLPLIVLTSLDETAVVLDSARGGAVDYLVKSRMSRTELSRAILYAVERTRIERARRQAEESLRALVEDSADAMLVVDEEGLVQFANPAAARLFGREGEELVGDPFPFDVSAEQTQEVHVEGPDAQERAVAEMRVVPTVWQGRAAKLATLRDVTDLVELREELRSMSLRDELTGLYNRRGLLALGEQQLKLADRARKGLLLMFADVDGLKAINDEHGHQEGDRALKAVASALGSSFRESDLIARVGGDEFCVLAFGARKLDVEQLSQRLQDSLNERLASAKVPYQIALSVGAAYRDPEAPMPIEKLMENKKRKRRGG